MEFLWHGHPLEGRPERPSILLVDWWHNASNPNTTDGGMLDSDLDPAPTEQHKDPKWCSAHLSPQQGQSKCHIRGLQQPKHCAKGGGREEATYFQELILGRQQHRHAKSGQMCGTWCPGEKLDFTLCGSNAISLTWTSSGDNPAWRQQRMRTNHVVSASSRWGRHKTKGTTQPNSWWWS